MDETDFNFLFPYKSSDWTYERFLKAAAHYPRFCGRVNQGGTLTIKETCSQELAVLLSHMATDTNLYDEFDILPIWR